MLQKIWKPDTYIFNGRKSVIDDYCVPDYGQLDFKCFALRLTL